MARRLPVYLVVDSSESMAGREQSAMNEAIASITRTLRSNPYALETVWVSVLAFAGRAKQLVPLTEIVRFIPPDLPVGGGTSLSRGLELLMSSIDTEVRRATPEVKGDWRPLVFILTDGHPTDPTSASIQKWRSGYAGRATLVAVSIGGQADHGLLRQLTEDVVVFNDAAPDAFARFAQWISSSVSTQSERAAAGKGDVVTLSKSLEDVVRPVDDLPQGIDTNVDERYAVLVGRCSGNKKPYLLKFAKPEGQTLFMLDSAIPLEPGYFDLCDEQAPLQSVSTSVLGEGSSCPHCHNEAGISGCQCGNILCTAAGGGTYTCPWCGITGQWGQADRAFDVHRGRG